MGDDVTVTGQGRRSMRGVAIAGLFCLMALVIYLVARFSFEPQSRWLDYSRAYQCFGGAALVGSGLWLIFALLKARTNFFSVDRKIGPDEFRTTVALVLISTVVVLVLAVTNLPGMAPPGQAQMEAPERARQTRIDKGLKIFVPVVVILAGAIVMSLPLRRLRKG